ncbi:MAG: porin [bacterium]
MLKKLFVVAILVVCVSGYSGLAAAGDVTVSGAVEIQYRNSSDIYKSTGDDKLVPEELYVQVKKEVSPDIDALIKIDGADMNNKTGASYTSNTVEEAQVIFKNIKGRPLTLVVGKDEMPFGQDYEKFYFSTLTHGFEIDKVWGVNAKYDIDKVGPLEAAVFKKDTTSQTALSSSYALRLTLKNLAEGLTVEGSVAQKGKNKIVATSENETRASVGGKYKKGALTIHAENTSIKKSGGTSTSKDPSVTEFGVDYLFVEYLLKGFYESRDDDVDGDQAGSIKNQYGVGVSHMVSKTVTFGIEYATINYEAKHATYNKDSVGEVVVTTSIKY